MNFLRQAALPLQMEAARRDNIFGRPANLEEEKRVAKCGDNNWPRGTQIWNSTPNLALEKPTPQNQLQLVTNTALFLNKQLPSAHEEEGLSLHQHLHEASLLLKIIATSDVTEKV